LKANAGAVTTARQLQWNLAPSAWWTRMQC
jgi:hypothetical protein